MLRMTAGGPAAIIFYLLLVIVGANFIVNLFLAVLFQEIMVARAPIDLKPKVLQVRHGAMKVDMDAQMRRIARTPPLSAPAVAAAAGSQLDAPEGSAMVSGG